ncbi:phage tail tape measure protein [Dysgonomonas sp. 216]|uniref:phage tail tape measure protein n=1 Tax=Dysgonomonas sp. 216 TaxID=2302934 RepID=UPI0013D3EFCA|nr:phage tail tape measure protein [Dysgonomonas sp. 216]NDW19140.1 phage tail tape measure protein [Dysgonomonas sp. 216]
MAIGKSKIELVLEIKNRIKSGLSSAKKQIRSDVGEMRARIAEFKASAKKDFKEIAGSIPVIGGNLKSLTGGIGLVLAGIGLLSAGMIKATDRAAEFNAEFRGLANLNLTKTQKEINDLRTLVLDTAWKKGFDSIKTSDAYNEVQSTVGLYGNDARAIVEKQGEFANIMQADMTKWVAGTSKAMANWRFGIDRLDDFNKSAYAAMQVGVVSFEQLANVQSVYAGAAASVKQDFDTANKLFSLFTIKTKSPEVAATLTKSLFNDLTKKSTVDAFKKIGINFYDTNKQLKQADVIMLELNKKFMQMKDDKSIITLKNQFAGSEGLIAMIQAATDKSGELKKTFDEFTESKFNFDSAKTMAENDILYRQEQLSNRIDNLIIRMGQVLLPIKEKLVGFAEGIVTGIDWMAKDQKGKRQTIIDDEANHTRQQNADLLNIENLTQEQFDKRMAYFNDLSKQFKTRYDNKTNEYANPSGAFYNYNPFYLAKSTKGRLEYRDEQNNYLRHRDFARWKTYSGLADELDKKWYNRNTIQDSSTSTTGSTGETITDDGSGGKSVNGIVGSAKQIRNITVNIEAFNKGGINIQSTTLQNMDASQIENWFIDTCLRAVRQLETSY